MAQVATVVGFRGLLLERQGYPVPECDRKSDMKSDNPSAANKTTCE
jgi:hypothetical protein